MGGVSFTVSGDKEVARLLEATGRRLEDAVRGAVAETALNIETGAKRNAPVDTGRLRSSIGTEIVGDGLAADVGSNVEYASYVETGTSVMAAQPFLTPAAEVEAGKFTDTVAKHARRVTG